MSLRDAEARRLPRLRGRSLTANVVFAAVTLILITTVQVRAQEGMPAPPGGLLSGIGKKMAGSSNAAPGAAKTSATRFTPSGKRLYASKMADSLAETAEQKKAFNQLFETGLQAYEAEAKKRGISNDVAPALTFLIQTQWSVYNGGREAPDGADDKLLAQIRGVLAGEEMARASDAEKQQLYEYCVCTAVLTLGLYEVAKEGNDADSVKAIRKAAGDSLKALLGVEPDQVRLTANGLEGVGGTASRTVTKPGARETGTVAGAKVTFQMPGNRKRVADGGEETVTWSKEQDDELTIVTANISNTNPNVSPREDLRILVLPPQTTGETPDEVFEKVWGGVVNGMKTRQGATVKRRSLTYRYYLPSGAVCYATLTMLQPQNQWDRVFVAVYLLDFGNAYLPVVRVINSVNTETDATMRGAVDRSPTRDSEPDGLEDETNGFLFSLRVTGATTPRPIASRAQFVGKWVTSSTAFSSTDYYSTATGAFVGSKQTSSASVTRYILNADGTGTYSFQWVYNGVLKTETIVGRWTFDRDRLTVTDKTGKTRADRVVFAGKDAKTGRPFFVLSGGIPDKFILTPLQLLQRNEYFAPDTKN